MSISNYGITGNSLSKEEFNLLPYIDSRAYIDSSNQRFNEWESSFQTNHPDWEDRVKVQSLLAKTIEDSLAQKIQEYSQLNSIKMVFLGASLGSISSYFVLNSIKKLGLLNKIDLTIYDLLIEPLRKTKNGEFDFSKEAEIACGFADNFSVKEYKEVLKNVSICSGSITNLPEFSCEFDIAIAPYVQHHLNAYDKKIACQQIKNIVKKNGLIAIGDLSFNHQTFNDWLKKHTSEGCSYAIESFISQQEHIGLFPGCDLIRQNEESFYYSFVLKNI